MKRKRMQMVRSLLYEDDYVIRPGHTVTLLLDQLSALWDAGTPYMLDKAPDNDLLSDANTLVYRRRFAAQTQPDSTAELYVFVKNTDCLNEIRYDGIAMKNYAVTNEAGKVLVSDRREWTGRASPICSAQRTTP